MGQDETPVTGYRLGDVYLDVRNRQLWRDGQSFPLNTKYFEALLLLVRERGRLVEKRRLFDEVWEGVPVTDTALTQCIKDIRRQLGDDASSPRYIKTVPKHGYIFIFDAVEVVTDGESPGILRQPVAEGFGQVQEAPGRAGEWAMESLGGTMGGGVAGVMGGLMLGGGLAVARQASASEAISLLFVMVGLGTFIGVAGGMGVSGGMVVADHLAERRRGWSVAGAIAGGMIVGGIAQFFGVDALRALFGHRLAGITGAFEGAAIGAGVSIGGLAGGWGMEQGRAWRRIAGGAAGTMCAAILLTLAGRTLFSGSIEVLARAFADSQIGLDPLSRLFGEAVFGRVTQVILGAVEGVLFGAGVMGGMWVASERRTGVRREA